MREHEQQKVRSDLEVFQSNLLWPAYQRRYGIKSLGLHEAQSDEADHQKRDVLAAAAGSTWVFRWQWGAIRQRRPTAADWLSG
jgi:hypothetical protein